MRKSRGSVSMAMLAAGGVMVLAVGSDRLVPAGLAAGETPATPAKAEAIETEPLTPAAKTDPKPGSTALVSAGHPAAVLDVSLQNEVIAAVNRSLDWLAAQQKPNGAWSNDNFPALTAFAVRAFVQSSHPKKAEVLEKGIKYILSCVQPDGGIYRKVEGGQGGGGLSNYNTAICMAALYAADPKAHAAVVLNARKFIAGSQHFGDDVYKGGFGYDRNNRPYTDLDSTVFAEGAMVETAGVEDSRPKGEKRVDINWAETVKYISKLQNKPDAGPDQQGGFFYKPGESKAGATTNEAGVVVFRSFGSITYVGLLALIYADVSRDDVRVRSAFDWAARHWSLDENPGMGAQGLYFFYNVLTKSLSAYGADVVPQKPGKFVNWREEIARKLVGTQKIDPKTGNGYWVNAEGRFWESDPVLATAYSVLALEMVK